MLRTVLRRALRTAPAGTGALLALIALPCAAAGATGAVSPLPASDYAVRPVCAAPAPGQAGCLALDLVPSTAAARAHTHPLAMTRSQPILAAAAAEGAFGLRPQDLHSIYQLPTTAPSTQTIAIVDAYADSTAEHDLGVYDQEFGLPGCNSANGCFRQVNQQGSTGDLPIATGKKEKEEADEWTLETSLDIEVAHAVCPSCQILLVEANSASLSLLATAEQTAARLHATEISDSWGGPECSEGPRGRECVEDSPAFNQQGVVITAAAGDEGYLDWGAEESSERGYADYPASSPHVVAVGGTRLQLPLGAGATWTGETVWNGDGAGGGGCSVQFTAPPWQQSTPDWLSLECGTHRAVADVSADADPYTGVAVYDSTPILEEGKERLGWATLGGTSLASPIIAATFALAGGAGTNAGGEPVRYPARTLYENLAATPGLLHDVTKGSNGECQNPVDTQAGPLRGTSGCTLAEEAAQCSGKAVCLAGPGYDGPTGVGTPNGIAAFQPGGQQAGGGGGGEKQSKSEGEKNKAEGGGPETGVGSGAGGNGSTNGASENSEAGASGSAGAGQASGASDIEATGSATGAGTATGKATIRLSAFALTPSALIALNRSGPKVSAVGFAFTLSAATRVRATLAKRVRVRGHGQWKLVPGALTFAAAKGPNHRRLANRDALTPGRYRLTLTPRHGSARSLIFLIG
jgi:hypothetical protein